MQRQQATTATQRQLSRKVDELVGRFRKMSGDGRLRLFAPGEKAWPWLGRRDHRVRPPANGLAQRRPPAAAPPSSRSTAARPIARPSSQKAGFPAGRVSGKAADRDEMEAARRARSARVASFSSCWPMLRTTGPDPNRELSIAVLPFANQSSEVQRSVRWWPATSIVSVSESSASARATRADHRRRHRRSHRRRAWRPPFPTPALKATIRTGASTASARGRTILVPDPDVLVHWEPGRAPVPSGCYMGR